MHPATAANGIFNLTATEASRIGMGSEERVLRLDCTVSSLVHDMAWFQKRQRMARALMSQIFTLRANESFSEENTCAKV